MFYITGIAGFVGSNLANRMSSIGMEVSGCDNLKFGVKDNTFVPFEVKDFDQVKLSKDDVLIHCACDNIIYGIEYPVETFKTNALKSIELFRRFNGRIVYLSTSSIYGQASTLPTPESHPHNVYNAYDQSKLIAELFLKQRGNYTTLRLSNVYGVNQRPSNPYAGVIGKFVGLAKSGFSLPINGSGSQTRDYTHVDDVVDAIIRACLTISLETEINIGTGVETSVMDIALMVSDLSEVQVVSIPERPIDKIHRRCLDISKADALLDWHPTISVKEGIEMLWKNYK